MTGLYVIQYPSGKFGFVGKVPAELAFTSHHPDDLATASICGPGLARKQAERNGRTFNTRTWESAEAAIQSAKDAGFSAA